MQISDDEKPEKIISQCIDDATQYLPILTDGLRNVSRLCQEGREGEGVNQFLEAIEGLEWLASLMQGISTFNIQRNGIKPSEKPFDQLTIEYNEKLIELLSAWENGDFVLISDLIEYELVPLLDEIVAAFQGNLAGN